MTREQYLEVKTRIKTIAANRKLYKQEFRNWQRENPGKSTYQCNIKTDAPYIEYRAKHIFISMVRGKSRSQIEGNFEKQDWSSYPLLELERYIKAVCEKYEYEMNLDESMRVIEITPIVKELKVGA